MAMKTKAKLILILSSVTILGYVIICKTKYYDKNNLSMVLPSFVRMVLPHFSVDDVALGSDQGVILSPEVTVVTAFFDIGSFQKGLATQIRKPHHYTKWINAFKSLDNPLVFYTDSKKMYDQFTELRKTFPPNRTKLFLIDRTKLWSFSLAREIRLIFNQPKYPKHLPNTVNENYTCLTHAKYELLQKVIKERIFPTKYLTWVDVGIYRHKNFSEIFHVELPSKMDESKVVFSLIKKFANKTINAIIKGNLNWVGGGILMGRQDTLLTFTEDYLEAVKALLDHRLMNVEQQVIYAMYSSSFYFSPRVQIQALNRGRYNDWFCLAEMTRVKGYYNGSRTTSSSNNPISLNHMNTTVTSRILK